MTAPACRKGLRRKNGRKANFRQVQTSAARSFGSQSNQISTYGQRSETRAASLTYSCLRWQSHAEPNAYLPSSESPELAQPISGVQRWRPRCRLDPGHPLTRIPGAKKGRENRKVPSPPRGGEGLRLQI